MEVAVTVLVYLDPSHARQIVSVHTSRTDAIDALAGILARQWHRVAGRDGAAFVPDGLPAPEVISQYLRVTGRLDSYSLTSHIVDVTDQLGDLIPVKPR